MTQQRGLRRFPVSAAEAIRFGNSIPPSVRLLAGQAGSRKRRYEPKCDPYYRALAQSRKPPTLCWGHRMAGSTRRTRELLQKLVCAGEISRGGNAMLAGRNREMERRAEAAPCLFRCTTTPASGNKAVEAKTLPAARQAKNTRTPPPYVPCKAAARQGAARARIIPRDDRLQIAGATLPPRQPRRPHLRRASLRLSAGGFSL